MHGQNRRSKTEGQLQKRGNWISHSRQTGRQVDGLPGLRRKQKYLVYKRMDHDPNWFLRKGYGKAK